MPLKCSLLFLMLCSVRIKDSGSHCKASHLCLHFLSGPSNFLTVTTRHSLVLFLSVLGMFVARG